MHCATIMSNFLARFSLPSFTSFKENAVALMIIKIKNNVTPCSVSTSVKEVDSGKEESIIYLLPITANNEPTLNPNLESMPSG